MVTERHLWLNQSGIKNGDKCPFLDTPLFACWLFRVRRRVVGLLWELPSLRKRFSGVARWDQPQPQASSSAQHCVGQKSVASSQPQKNGVGSSALKRRRPSRTVAKNHCTETAVLEEVLALGISSGSPCEEQRPPPRAPQGVHPLTLPPVVPQGAETPGVVHQRFIPKVVALVDSPPLRRVQEQLTRWPPVVSSPQCPELAS